MNTFTRRQAVAHSILMGMGIRALAPASVAAGALVESDEGYDEAGLESPTSYTSPTHGYTVRWDPAWGVDSERVDPVLWDKLDIDRYQDIPVYTDGEHYDRLDIWLPERDARLRIIGQHVVSGVGVHTPSMGATANAASGSAVTLMVVEEAGRAVVVHRHAMNDGTTLLSYNNLVPMPDADAWLWVQLAAPEDAFRDAFERVGDHIGIDLADYAWDGLVTVDDIVDASAAEPLVPASDVGITSATGWTDPVFGIEVTWAPTMTTYENLARGSDASRWLNLGTKFRALVPVEVFTSDVGFEKTVEEMVNHQIENRRPEHEVLLHRIDANRGMVLTRSYLSNGDVYADYREYMVTGDGAALAITTFSAPIAGNEFPHRFGRVVGSVTVAGNQFGEIVDPAIIIAAAQSPLDPESFLAD